MTDMAGYAYGYSSGTYITILIGFKAWFTGTI